MEATRAPDLPRPPAGGRMSSLVTWARALAIAALGLAIAGCDGTLRATDPAGPGEREAARRDDVAHPERRSEGRVPAATVVAIGSVIEARVTRVRDGDSLDATLADGRTLGLRLAGIDAPERSQPHAAAARRHLAALADGRPIRAEVVALDRYDRAVAHVALRRSDANPGDLPDLGLAQVAAGFAWFFRRYADDLSGPWAQRYDAAERAAREQRAGLWRDRAPIPPWRYREALRAR